MTQNETKRKATEKKGQKIMEEASSIAERKDTNEEKDYSYLFIFNTNMLNIE